MKETYYFSHDYSARSDDKIKRLIRKHGMLGYGVYWAIVEDLYNNANALQMDSEGIAYDLRVNENIVVDVIKEFELFEVKGDKFYSESVNRRLDERAEKSRNAKKAALKRWGKLKDINANAMQSHSNRNAIKERKGKDITILIESVSSPPEGVDALYFYIAKSFHSLFLKKGKTKTLEKAEVNKWVNIVRLMVEVDKIPLEQIIAIKYYWELCLKGERGMDTFWIDTVLSIASFRKKDKDGCYYYDKITQSVKKWIDKTPGVKAEIKRRTENLKRKAERI